MDNALLDQLGLHSLLGWGIGLLLGGGLGLLTGYVARAIFRAIPFTRGLSMLLPWRTFVMAAILAIFLFLTRRTVMITLLNLIRSPLAFTLEGLGEQTNILLIAAIVAVLALPWAVGQIADNGRTLPLGIRLIAMGRTMGIVAIAATVALGLVSGAGVGGFLSMRIGLLDFLAVSAGWASIFTMWLLVDLVFGLVQTIVYFLSEAN